MTDGKNQTTNEIERLEESLSSAGMKMSPPPTFHPEPDLLKRVLVGEASTEENRAVRLHILDCLACSKESVRIRKEKATQAREAGVVIDITRFFRSAVPEGVGMAMAAADQKAAQASWGLADVGPWRLAVVEEEDGTIVSMVELEGTPAEGVTVALEEVSPDGRSSELSRAVSDGEGTARLVRRSDLPPCRPGWIYRVSIPSGASTTLPVV